MPKVMRGLAPAFLLLSFLGLAGCASRPAVERTVKYGPTIRERLWMWGHHPEFTLAKYDGKSICASAGSVDKPGSDMAEACRFLGIPNCCVVLYNPKEHPLNAFTPQFRDMGRVAWSIVDGGGGETKDRLATAYEAKRMLPNLDTLYLDDYFVKSMGLTKSAADLAKVRDEIHARGFKLACVLYSDQDGLKPEFKESVDLCDEVSYWFWRAENLAKGEESIRACRRYVGEGKSLLLGVYMFDFGGGNKPIPRDVMLHQLDVALRLLRDGTVDGLIFHCTPMCNLGLEAVELSRQWIAEHGDERIRKSN